MFGDLVKKMVQQIIHFNFHFGVPPFMEPTFNESDTNWNIDTNANSIDSSAMLTFCEDSESRGSQSHRSSERNTEKHHVLRTINIRTKHTKMCFFCFFAVDILAFIRKPPSPPAVSKSRTVSHSRDSRNEAQQSSQLRFSKRSSKPPVLILRRDQGAASLWIPCWSHEEEIIWRKHGDIFAWISMDVMDGIWMSCWLDGIECMTVSYHLKYVSMPQWGPKSWLGPIHVTKGHQRRCNLL